MNKIQGLLDKSDYENYLDYINFRIDDFWLNEKFDQLYSNNFHKNLIPTLNGIMNDNEDTVVWKRILPEENQTAICPILMCEDDLDFSCSLIVAEIKNCGEIIQWKRIGIDKTKEWEAEKVGTAVKWLDKIPVFNFAKTDYLKMLEDFK